METSILELPLVSGARARLQKGTKLAGRDYTDSLRFCVSNTLCPFVGAGVHRCL